MAANRRFHVEIIDSSSRATKILRDDFDAPNEMAAVKLALAKCYGEKGVVMGGKPDSSYRGYPVYDKRGNLKGANVAIGVQEKE